MFQYLAICDHGSRLWTRSLNHSCDQTHAVNLGVSFRVSVYNCDEGQRLYKTAFLNHSCVQTQYMLSTWRGRRWEVLFSYTLQAVSLGVGWGSFRVSLQCDVGQSCDQTHAVNLGVSFRVSVYNCDEPQLSSNTAHTGCRLRGSLFVFFHCNAIKDDKYTHVVFIIFDAMKGKGSRQRLKTTAVLINITGCQLEREGGYPFVFHSNAMKGKCSRQRL